MNILKGMILFIIGLLVIFWIQPTLYSQDYNNVLPLHTGKSYILDFPVKVTRVVGGDPSAMELNLFKKDAANGEIPGYQLLIAPIAEKNTNIIVWTEIGMYVFDVDIDNSSPYTAETIVIIPKIKRFTIPLTESSNSKSLPNNLNKDNQVAISKTTGDIIENNNEKETKQNIENKENINVAQKTDYLDVLQKPNNSDMIQTGEIKLDAPPPPQKENSKKKKKHSLFFGLKKEEKKIDTTNNKEETLNTINHTNKEEIKKADKTEKNNENSTKALKIELKPQIPITTNTASKKSEEEITLNSSVKSNYTQSKSNNNSNIKTNHIPEKITAKEIKDPLKLSINKISKFDDKIIINISVANNSSECKYVLWDLTKVLDQNGNSFYVRNMNLPPGIINPAQSLTGDIVAYSKPGKKNQITTTNLIKVSLFGSQGQLLINSDISVK